MRVLGRLRGLVRRSSTRLGTSRAVARSRSRLGRHDRVKPLRLFPEEGAESPIWSDGGNVSFDQVRISDSLRIALINWSNEALDAGHPDAARSEDEWEAEGRLLAARLQEETGAPVICDP